MKKNVSPQLKSHKYYLNPCLGADPEYECVLLSYSSEEIQQIVEQFLKIFVPSNPQYSNLEKVAFDYAMNVSPYGLRYNDGNDQNHSIFNRSLDLFFIWIQKLPFETNYKIKQQYIQRFLLYLTQIYLNPSFKLRINGFCNNIRKCFFDVSGNISKETKFVLLKFLIVGCLDLSKNSSDEFQTLAQLLMEIIVLYVSNEEKNWIDPVLENLIPLFEYQDFTAIVSESFSTTYFRAIADQSPSQTLLDFMYLLVNSYFPPLEKHKAFETVVKCWMKASEKKGNKNLKKDNINGNYTNNNNNNNNSSSNLNISFSNNSSKENLIGSAASSASSNSGLLSSPGHPSSMPGGLLCVKTPKIFAKNWPTESIKEQFFRWFSIEFECAPGQIRGNRKSLPIFDLLQFGEPEKEPTVKRIAEQVILKEFSSPEEADLFWYIPVFSLNFLQQNTDFLIKDNHYEVVFAFFDKFLKNPKFGGDCEIMIPLATLIFLILELMIPLQNSQLIERCIRCIEQLPNNDVRLNLYVSFIQYSANLPSQIWTRLFACMKEPSFSVKSYLFYIYLSFFALLSDDQFFSEFEIQKEFWECVQRSIRDASEKTRDLYYLSLYILTLHSKIFLQHPGEAAFYVSPMVTADQTFPYYLRCAILAGSNYKLGYESSRNANGSNVMHFATSKYIFSVIDNNTIEIRSPLGINSFTVQLKKKEGYDPVPLPTVVKNGTVVNDDKTSIDYIPDDDFSKEILQIRNLCLEKSSDKQQCFTKYQNREGATDQLNTSCYDAFLFLIDLGIFTFNDADTIRIVPIELIDQIVALDTINSKPTFSVNLFQVFEEGSMDSVVTTFLDNFIADVCTEPDMLTHNTDICQISFFAPCKCSDDRSKDSGIIIILNETNHIFKKSNFHINEYDCLIFVNQVNDYYFVELFDKSGNIPFPFPYGHNTQFVHKSNLKKLIVMTILLYFVNPYQQIIKGVAPNGPGKFSSNIQCRMKIIEEIYRLSNMTPNTTANMFVKFSKLMCNV